MAEAVLNDGSALGKFRAFVAGQGGDPRVIDDYGLFPQAEFSKDIRSEEEGYVSEIEARAVGFASQHSGAGRAAKDDSIDMAAGIYLHTKVGDKVVSGEALATVYGNSLAKVEAAVIELKKAFHISKAEPVKFELIKKILI
jgi:thymidine phosphorylase